MAETVASLHELLSSELAALKELLASQRADDALAVAERAAETERRLASLNHAHEEAVRVQHTYVTEEKWDAMHSSLASRIDTAEKAIVTLNAGAAGRRAGDSDTRQAGDRARALLFGAVAAAVAVGSLLLGVRTAHPTVTVVPAVPTTVR